MSSTRDAYHHGDLRSAIKEEAIRRLKIHGVQKLSLRSIAEQIGVSAPAIYHHFRNKHDLLVAMALDTLDRFQQEVALHLSATGSAWPEPWRRFAFAYIRFALQEPELYELLFGRVLWHEPGDDTFRRAARQVFREYGEQLNRLLPHTPDPLRLAQTSWATLHGLVRMHNDGLSFSSDDLYQISEYAVQSIASHL